MMAAYHTTALLTLKRLCLDRNDGEKIQELFNFAFATARARCRLARITTFLLSVSCTRESVLYSALSLQKWANVYLKNCI